MRLAVDRAGAVDRTSPVVVRASEMYLEPGVGESALPPKTTYLPSGVSAEFAPDFVNYNHFGHMILDRFDHDFVLQGGCRHLHSSRFSDRGKRSLVPVSFIHS